MEAAPRQAEMSATRQASFSAATLAPGMAETSPTRSARRISGTGGLALKRQASALAKVVRTAVVVDKARSKLVELVQDHAVLRKLGLSPPDTTFAWTPGRSVCEYNPADGDFKPIMTEDVAARTLQGRVRLRTERRASSVTYPDLREEAHLSDYL